MKDPLYQPEDFVPPVSPEISVQDNSDNILTERDINQVTDQNLNMEMIQKPQLVASDTNNIPQIDSSINSVQFVQQDLSNRGRKRKRNEHNWRKKLMKRLKNSGQSYESTVIKKIIPERKMDKPCSERCKLRCSTLFTENERKVLFEEYWALGDTELQWNILQIAWLSLSQSIFMFEKVVLEISASLTIRITYSYEVIS